MRKLSWLGLVLGLVMGSATVGCTVRETVVARPAAAPGCRGGVWIQGHYGPRGRWWPGHWRCPGTVERIEIY
jgi:hypothetical protein